MVNALPPSSGRLQQSLLYQDALELNSKSKYRNPKQTRSQINLKHRKFQTLKTKSSNLCAIHSRPHEAYESRYGFVNYVPKYLSFVLPSFFVKIPFAWIFDFKCQRPASRLSILRHARDRLPPAPLQVFRHRARQRDRRDVPE